MERIHFAMISGVVTAALLAVLAPHPAVAIECGRNKSHNIFMGTKQYGDILLHMEHPKVDGKWLRTVSADVDTGNLSRRINYIELIDANTKGKGGCAYLTSGGVGNYRAAFHIKSSQTGEGIDFTFRVFGR